MRSSDFLHRLIKSLSKGDRRNFKVYARLQDGDKKYVQLFDAIGKQEKYDEKKLLKQFQGERFTKQFSVAKNYLYNYILKTLHVFQKDPHAELTTLIHQVEILIGKNLFDQAQKLLRKAKHMAERHERFGELLELLYHERQILHQMQKVKEYDVFVKDIQQQEKEAVAKMNNLMAYFHLYDDVYRLVKKSGSARVEEEKGEIERILNSPLLAEAASPLSARAKLKSYFILGDCYRMLHDFEKCLHISSLVLEEYEKHAELKIEHNIKYIDTLYNLGVYKYQLGSLVDSQDALEKLRKVETYSEQEKIRVFELYFTFKLSLGIDTLNLEQGKVAIEDMEELLPLFGGKIKKSVELTLYYLTSYIYFLAGDPSKALVWVNKLINEPKTEFRMDYQCMARILNLLVHYELGNIAHMDGDIKAAYRFLSNRDRLLKFEQTALKYIKRLVNLHPDQTEIEVFLEFQTELNKVMEDSSEKKAVSILNLPKWIELKLSGEKVKLDY